MPSKQNLFFFSKLGNLNCFFLFKIFFFISKMLQFQKRSRNVETSLTLSTKYVPMEYG